MTTLHTLARASALPLLGLLSLPLGATAQTAAPKTVRIRYAPELARTPLVEGKALTTYAVKAQPAWSAEEAAGLARRLAEYAKAELETQPQRLESARDRVFFKGAKDPSAVLALDLGRRRISFNQGLLAYRDEKETAGLPGEGEVLDVVRRHLAALDLTPPHAELAKPVVGGLNMAVRREDGSTAIYRKLVKVRYDRTLDGLPVEGGSRVVAQLGEGGALVSLAWEWPAVEGRAVRAEELRPEARLRRELEARLRRDLAGARDILVERTDLVLYQRGAVMEPAVRVVAKATFVTRMAGGKAGETRRYEQPYDTIVPVLLQPRALYPFEADREAVQKVKRDQPTAAQRKAVPQKEEAGEK
jgi:hypothetical protein